MHEITVAIVDGPCVRRQARFAKGRIVIGRGRSDEGDLADFVMDEDPSVSRVQAVLLFEEGQWRIENRSRHKSTVVNGRARDSAVLADGDTVEVGGNGSRIEVHIPSAGGDRPSVKSGQKGVPAWIWMACAGVVVVSAVLVVLLPSGDDKKSVSPVDIRRLAIRARNAGDVTNALALIAPVSTNSAENVALYRECRALAKRFEQARRLEEALQLDGALDVWRLIVVESLQAGDPLRTWVQTGQVDRLERRITELRQ